MNALNLNLKRKLQVSIAAGHFSKCNLRDDLSPPAKGGSQSVRDNSAAWVAGPGRICFS